MSKTELLKTIYEQLSYLDDDEVFEATLTVKTEQEILETKITNTQMDLTFKDNDDIIDLEEQERMTPAENRAYWGIY